MTMNEQWAYHPDPTLYKSPRTLVRFIAEIAGKGGNLLLNVGPKPDGTFPDEAVARLDAIGEWMSHSGESIYDALAGPHPACFYGPMTRKESTLYIHVFDPPLDRVEVRGIDAPLSRARLLRTGKQLDFEVKNGRIYVDLRAEDCDPYNTVVALEFAQPPDWP